MEKEEAVSDAVEQFRQQGVDLSGLDLTGAAIRDDGTIEVSFIIGQLCMGVGAFSCGALGAQLCARRTHQAENSVCATVLNVRRVSVEWCGTLHWFALA